MDGRVMGNGLLGCRNIIIVSTGVAVIFFLSLLIVLIFGWLNPNPMSLQEMSCYVGGTGLLGIIGLLIILGRGYCSRCGNLLAMQATGTSRQKAGRFSGGTQELYQCRYCGNEKWLFKDADYID
jgi:hypothetical protein